MCFRIFTHSMTPCYFQSSAKKTSNQAKHWQTGLLLDVFKQRCLCEINQGSFAPAIILVTEFVHHFASARRTYGSWENVISLGAVGQFHNLRMRRLLPFLESRSYIHLEPSFPTFSGLHRVPYKKKSNSLSSPIIVKYTNC